jgi:predicted ATPase/DNA-binding SARP family transcriptional activator
MTPPWTILLLGGLRVQHEKRQVTRFRTQKAASLLAYLALHPAPQPRETLIDQLWPDAEMETGRHNLSNALTFLRHVLEPPGIPAGTVLLADRASVRLNPAAVTTDVVAFERDLDRAEAAALSETERRALLQQALERYQGPLLPGFYEEWIGAEALRLESRFMQAVVQQVLRLLAAGNREQALSYARRAVTTDPLSEEATFCLMQALSASGQSGQALRAYRQLQTRLEEELDTRPSKALQEMAHRLKEPTRKPAEKEHEALAPAPLPAGSPLPSGTVTFLLTDIEGSTALWEQTGEAFREALEVHHRLLRSLFAAHHGHEVKEMGDGFLVAFARAGDALACAVDAQKRLEEKSGRRGEGEAQDLSSSLPPLKVRMALHSGEVEPAGGDYHHLTIHRASRLLAITPGGQILCSEACRGLLGEGLPEGVRLVECGVYRLRDIPAPQRLFQVVWEGREAGAAPLGPVGSAPVGRLLGGEFLRRTTTRFFGREEEMARLGKMLSAPRTRLVTITGPGGTGKTRLAIEAAAQLVSDVEAQERALSGAVFVSLAELSEAERLFEVILRALGLLPVADLAPLDQLVQALLSQPNTLLVLDNFEQLVEEGALRVRDLLAKTEKVKLLVTSRQKLNIEGEYEFHLAPLPISSGAQTSEELLFVSSIALFVDRAQAALPDFQLTERNAATVAQLCDYLEGLPLAIELAAARVSVLSPSRILEQVQADRLDFLSTRRRDAVSRQKTLRATLDWSYRLLPEAGQRFLAQVSAFRGGWTLAAAQAVCALSEEETLELLTLLRDSSLLEVTDTNEGLRFSLLETIRAYGQERLMELGEDAAVCRRHRDYFVALAEQAEPELMGPDQVMWLDRLQTEHDNLCAAIAWCEADKTSTQANLRLVGALSRFWEVRNYLSLGRGYLARALSRAEAAAPTAERAKALQGAGALSLRQSEDASARALLEESLTIKRALGDRHGIAASLHLLGNAAYQPGDHGTAQSLYEQSLAIRRELGDRGGIAASFGMLGSVAYHQHDYGTAQSLYEQSLAIRRELGDKWGIAYVLKCLADMASQQHDYGTAQSLYEQSLAIRRELGDRGGIANSLYFLGSLALAQGDYEAARTLLQESLALYRELRYSSILHVLGALGHVEREVGDYAQATTLYQESLLLRREMGDMLTIACSLEDFAGLAGRQGQLQRAVRLLGAAETLAATLGRTLPVGYAPEYARTVAAAHAALSEEAFASAWEQGRTMTQEQAVAYALEPESAAPAP